MRGEMFTQGQITYQEFAEDPFFEWDIETKGLIPSWVEEAMNKASAMEHGSPGRRPPPSKTRPPPAPTPLPVKSVSSTMEKTMNDEVENVLRDWNENVKRREKETFQIRPLRSLSQRSRGGTPTATVAPAIGERGGGGGGSSFGESDPSSKTKILNIERVHERDGAGGLDGADDPNIDSSSESLEEDMKRPLYVTCPRTGRRMVRMQFDVHGFESKDIKVKVVGRKVIIFAVHKETESGRKSTNEFCRKINMPDDVDIDRLQCTFSNGLLNMESPVVVKPAAAAAGSLSGSRQSVTSTGSRVADVPTPLNQPFVRASEMGQLMHINVEVGRVFRADDVVVKLRGSDKLIVSAGREEETEQSTLSASLKREFRLPRRIHPHSLRAGLTNDGILNVTAIIDEAVTVVVNGAGGPPRLAATNAAPAAATAATAGVATSAAAAASSSQTASTANKTTASVNVSKVPVNNKNAALGARNSAFNP